MKAWGAVSVCLLVWLQFGTVHAHTTACNQGNDPLCLEGNGTYKGVRDLLQNSEYFWFGHRYANDCPPALSNALLCENPAPDYLSIITRMRMSPDNETDSVPQYLRVVYSAPAGSYEACGIEKMLEATIYPIDPVHTVKADSWVLSHEPNVTWEAQQGATYTLVFWDAGYFRLQGLWINLQGDSIDSGEVVIPYQGPLNPLTRKHPYVFALYNQSGTLDRQDVWDMVVSMHNQDDTFKLHDLISNLTNLTDLAGVSLVRTQADAYSIAYGRARSIINNCPYLVTKELPNLQGVPLNTTDVNLTVSLDITYTTALYMFDACCRHHHILPRTLRVDPKLMVAIDPVYTMNAPRVHVVPSNLRFPFLFVDHRYTLVMLDTTNTSMPKLHWLAININDPMLATAMTIVPYQRVIVDPTVTSNHSQIVFILFEQQRELTVAQVEALTPDNCQGCDFNLTGFHEVMNLRLAALGGFRASADPYSRWQLYRNNSDRQAAMCDGQPGYADPCPAPCDATPPTNTCPTTCDGTSGDVVFRSSAVLTAASLMVLAWLF